jgi:hypothetical protein
MKSNQLWVKKMKTETKEMWNNGVIKKYIKTGI